MRNWESTEKGAKKREIEQNNGKRTEKKQEKFEKQEKTMET